MSNRHNLDIKPHLSEYSEGILQSPEAIYFYSIFLCCVVPIIDTASVTFLVSYYKSCSKVLIKLFHIYNVLVNQDRSRRHDVRKHSNKFEFQTVPPLLGYLKTISQSDGWGEFRYEWLFSLTIYTQSTLKICLLQKFY